MDHKQPLFLQTTSGSGSEEFDKFDANGDGQISPAELKQYLAEAGTPQGPNSIGNVMD